MDKTEIPALVRKAQRNDAAALQELLIRVQEPAYYISFRLLNDQDAAFAVTQSVLTGMFGNIDTIRKPEDFFRWIKIAIGEQCKKTLEAKHGMHLYDEVQKTEDSGEAFKAVKQKIPDESVSGSDVQTFVLQEVCALPAAQRMCVVLYYYGLMTPFDIAGALHISEKAVKNVLQTALVRLHRTITAQDGWPAACGSTSPLEFLTYSFHRDAQTVSLTPAQKVKIAAAAEQAAVSALSAKIDSEEEIQEQLEEEVAAFSAALQKAPESLPKQKECLEDGMPAEEPASQDIKRRTKTKKGILVAAILLAAAAVIAAAWMLLRSPAGALTAKPIEDYSFAAYTLESVEDLVDPSIQYQSVAEFAAAFCEAYPTYEEYFDVICSLCTGGVKINTEYADKEAQIVDVETFRSRYTKGAYLLYTEFGTISSSGVATFSREIVLETKPEDWAFSDDEYIARQVIGFFSDLLGRKLSLQEAALLMGVVRDEEGTGFLFQFLYERHAERSAPPIYYTANNNAISFHMAFGDDE